MGRYLAVRLYSMGITLAGLTVLVFLMLRLVPGTVVEQMIGADAVVSKEMVEQLKRFFGLDQPWYTQYLAWIGRLAHGDFGTSWRTGKPVVSLILERLPVTLELTLLSVTFALVPRIVSDVIVLPAAPVLVDDDPRFPLTLQHERHGGGHLDVLLLA